MAGKLSTHLGAQACLLALSCSPISERAASPPSLPPPAAAPAAPEVRAEQAVDTPSEPSTALPSEPEAPVSPAGPVVVIEPIYKYGGSSPLSDVAAFNRGELGAVTGAMPEGPKHPHPRVVIEVSSIRGGHSRKTIERDVRKASWHTTVSCYRLDAHREAELELDVTLALEIHRSGSIQSARVVESKGTAKHKAPSKIDKSPLASAPCLSKRIASLSLSSAKSGSSARVRFRVWPGDDPLAPPDDAIVPGDGEVDPAVARRAVTQALPALEECHRAARAYAPDLWGRLAARVHVDESGRVDEAFEVESTFPDEHLARCALGALRSVVFPPPEGGDVRLVVPLRFLPEGYAPSP